MPTLPDGLAGSTGVLTVDLTSLRQRKPESYDAGLWVSVSLTGVSCTPSKPQKDYGQNYAHEQHGALAEFGYWCGHNRTMHHVAGKVGAESIELPRCSCCRGVRACTRGPTIRVAGLVCSDFYLTIGRIFVADIKTSP